MSRIFIIAVLMSSFILAIPSINANNSKSIDIQCKYNFDKNKEFDAFIKNNSLKEQFIRKWYSPKRTMYFSINLDTKKASNGASGDGMLFEKETKVYIAPDTILIKEEIGSQNQLEKKYYSKVYTIDRLNGSLWGESFTENSKTHEIYKEYSLHGACKPIKRLF